MSNQGNLLNEPKMSPRQIQQLYNQQVFERKSKIY